ncbi:MAG: hypothetical protein PHR77_19590, partial [Kiritimatiellae bacterium]|nr:hypothetical protein [Kiritimatiellia bacterium]
MKSSIIIIAAFLAVGSGLAQTNGLEWLNVRDFGASGSKFETTAATTDGSNQITVANAGDLKVGQGVMVSKASPRFTEGQLWGPRKDYAKSNPAGDLVKMRGYDGSAGSWVVYVLDVPAGSSNVFRWTDDLGRTWHEKIPITGDWQPLGGGTEVCFGKHDWEAGYTATF